MGVINRIKQSGGGGGANIASTPVPISEAYLVRQVKLALPVGSSFGFTTMSIPTGFNLEVRKLQMKTTDQANGRLDDMNLSGNRLYFYQHGDFVIDFTEHFGGPIITNDFWTVSLSNLANAPGATDFYIWVYGKLVKE